MEQLESWSEFGVAMAGATAALAGLLIVAMSVNIEIIVTSKSLPSRAASSIATLLLACILSLLLLVPETPVWVFGIEVLVGAALSWVLGGYALAGIRHDAHGARVLKGAMSVLPNLVYALAGALILAGVPGGMPLFAAAAAVSIASAVLLSWVTLIEVRR